MTKSNASTPTNNLLDAPVLLELKLPAFDAVHLTLVGCGGTGSHIATGLGALLLALGLPYSLTLIDPDIVETKNVGRQLFAASDVGKPKTEVIAARLANAYGIVPYVMTRGVDALDWQTLEPRVLHLVIGAVDNPAARSVIANAVKRGEGALWWLDCGNENASGQVLLGNIADARKMRGAATLGLIDRLPAPHLVYPDLIKSARFPRLARAASCAELTALGEQGLMVNRMVAAWALELLDALLVRREVKWFGQRFDLRWGNTSPLTLDLPTLASACGLIESDLI